MSIRHTSTVPAPIAEVFDWHARSGAFARLSPPWLPATIVQEAGSLEDGIAILGLPGGLRWVARHDPDGYRPPYQFVDTISAGGPRSIPARAASTWRHTHSFEEIGPTATKVIDRVKTTVGSRPLRAMFYYRHAQLAEDLASHQRARERGLTPMAVAITGSTGLIGTALSAFLSTGGHRVIRLVRRDAENADERRWDPMDPDPRLLDDVDAVVHLAGASLGGRFTAARKHDIRHSRIRPTLALARVAAGSKNGPKVFVCASAIGLYGNDRGGELLTESSPAGSGLIADLVSDWENATAPARKAGIRVVNVRTGIVQSPRGGPLQLLRPLFQAGLGGRIADGTQWLSWIDIDDLLDVYLLALSAPELSGPVNAVAPNAVRNSEYTRILARVLRRPAIVPVPVFATRMLLRTAGSKELVEASQHVIPERLHQLGHVFRRANLEASLRHQLGRQQPSRRGRRPEGEG